MIDIERRDISQREYHNNLGMRISGIELCKLLFISTKMLEIMELR